MIYWLLKPLAIFVFKFCFKGEIIEKENIPRKGGFILASNHLSYLDPIVLGLACPRRLFFLAKSELFRNSLFALLIKILGAISIKRGSLNVQVLKEVIKRVRNRQAVVIFPQGTRTESQDYPILPGVGLLLKKTKAPLVCARIFGTQCALPPGEKKIRFYPLKVVFSQPLYLNLNRPNIEIAKEVVKIIYSLH